MEDPAYATALSTVPLPAQGGPLPLLGASRRVPPLTI